MPEWVTLCLSTVYCIGDVIAYCLADTQGKWWTRLPGGGYAALILFGLEKKEQR